MSAALCFVLSVAGCCSVPKGYTVVRNHIRLFDTPLTFPTDTNVLRFAASKGLWASRICLRDVVVRKGSLTFCGSDGRISITTNNSILAMKHGQKDATFPMQSKWGQFCFDLETHLLHFQNAIDARWWDDHSQRGIWDYSPKMIAVFTNGYWLVDIPFERSSDFDGDMGTLTLIPNWYAGPP